MADKCQYNVGCGWASTICGADLPCEKHDGEKCSHPDCDNPAVAGCSFAGQFVCGFPVCKDHLHGCGRHRRPGNG